LSAEHSDWLDLLSGEFDRDLMLPLLSGSMAGTLLPGDMLTVRPLGAERAHIGDIVVFRDERKLVAHRLIFVLKLFSFMLFVEKGDANQTATIIVAESIVGRVEAARRGDKIVLEMTHETRAEARRLAAKSLMRVSFKALKDLIKRMLGRHA
jgi:signal peptidase I